jgi:hypothetical protein
MQHIVIGEAQHLDAPAAHILVACIISRCVNMRVAIHFNHELGMQAGEIRIVRSDRLLPTKMPTLLAEMPEDPPHSPFRAGLV